MRPYLVALLLICLLFPQTAIVDDEQPVTNVTLATDLSGYKVAIFNGSTTEISESCKNASSAMYEWMNADVTFITADDVLDNALYRFDIFVIPPGNLAEYSIDLRSTGKAKIREYVLNGGSVVGISRGAHFASETADVYGVENQWGLNLFNGTGWGPVGGFIDQYMYTVDINKTIDGMDLSGIPDSLTMMGWESIRFQPDGNVPFNIIASYPISGNLPAMISYKLGHGCVFLSGIHPEFEEDGDRDNTAFFDHHEDPETDWPLMNEISLWMVETSEWDNASIPIDGTDGTSTTTDTTPTAGNDIPLPMESMLLAGGAGLAVIVIVGIGLLKRK